jgi:hypothetical protein
MIHAAVTHRLNARYTRFHKLGNAKRYARYCRLVTIIEWSITPDLGTDVTHT